MGLLHSGLMWLGVAGAIPIIIHLFNRQRYKRMRWAAMEWLMAAIKKTKRRMQLENLILLLIRVAVIVLLALALARPFFTSVLAGPIGESNTHVVVVLDVSYSMDYRGVDKSTPLEKARQVALGILNDLKTTESDRFSLILLTDNPSAAVGEPSSRLEDGKNIIGAAQATDMATSIPRTMELVRDALKKSTNLVKKVYLITDNQRGAWSVSEKERTRVAELFKEVSDLTSPNGGGIVLYDVGGSIVDNLAVVDLVPASKVLGVDQPSRFNVTIRNHGPVQASGVTLNILVDGARQSTMSLTIPAHDRVVETFHHTFRDPGPHAVAVELDVDNLLHDNRRSLAVDVRDSLKVLMVNGEKGPSILTDEVAALKLALNPSMEQRERVGIFAITEVLENGFAREDARKFDLVVLANLETISQEEVAGLEEYVKAGGGLLVFLGDKVEPHTYNELLYRNGEGLLPFALDKTAGDPANKEYVRVTGVDYSHPSMSFFLEAGEMRPALGRLLVSQWYALMKADARPDVRTIMSLQVPSEAPVPFLVERQMGRGRVVLCTSAPDYEWGLMPKVPGFVILFDQVAQYLASPPQRFRNVTVGEALEYTLKVNEYAKTFVVTTPRQTTNEVSPTKIGDHAFFLSFRGTSSAGLYSLERAAQAGESQPTLLTWYAVNVNPDEGFVEKMTEGELRAMYPQFRFTYFEQGTGSKPDQITVKTPASNIWKYLLAAVLGLLVLETILAQIFGAKR